MPASQAALGYGSVFYTGVAGSPIVYTAISEISSINFMDYTVTEVDVTHLLSPLTTEEAIPGMIKPGTIEITGNWTGVANQLNVDTLAIARTVFPWKITAPSAGLTVLTVTGTGFINKKEIGPMEPNKKTDFKFGIRVTGAITYVVA